ncbi:predicted protein [Naegleria gruberi]|uniref:Predicted protein n=1 Tax=Naegleria gruberi TaxID=5762 RepID=D2VUD3_NAEGR|nr:uncharacterized protein NAEGRDRAFT_72622 [Naegleria gruberi]EFC39606.1 predicted protein [Naegleria gruberi]|eukprot:XP_002672350.1 predicted protein [Naegleria gruberi strain NEG-M]
MANTVLGSTTAAKHAVGFNLSLLKGGTITQTIIGAIITALVIASTVATIILVSVGVGYNPPVAANDFASTYKRMPVTVDVLINDNDPRGGNLTLTQIVNQPKYGTVKILSRSQVVYQSIGSFSGNDTFSYEVSNSFVTANATVTVQVLNRPPQAVPIYKKISKNAHKALVDIFNYVGDNDERISDIDNDVLYVTGFADQQVISGNAQSLGSIEVDTYNGFLYTPVTGFNGIEKFNYTISDGNDTASSTVTVEVENDAPIAGIFLGETIVFSMSSDFSQEDDSGGEVMLVCIFLYMWGRYRLSFCCPKPLSTVVFLNMEVFHFGYNRSTTICE